VSKPDNSFTDKQSVLPITAILGFKDVSDGPAVQLRALQIASIAQFSIHSLVGQVSAGGLAVFLYRGHIAWPVLGLWLLTLIAVHVHGVFQARALAKELETTSVKISKLRELRRPVFSGFLWAVALLGFTPLGTGFEQLSLWAVVAVLLAGSALILTFTPLGTLAFSLIVGAAAGTSFALQEQYTLTGIVSLFVMVTIVGAMENARANFSARITEHGAAEKDEVVSLLLREFEENEADWLWQIDTARRVRTVSPRFAYALGQEQSEAEGKPLLELIAGDSWETGQFASSLHELAELLKHRRSFSNQIVNVSIKGKQRWWELSGTPILDERGTFNGFRGVGSDVTEQQETSEKIEYLARYDTLTSLPNRLQVHEALGEALRYAEQWRTRCAFLMVDLDRFKAVNDSLGHMVGDQLLAHVSSRLEAIAGDTHFCGRLGGDEFAVVIRDASDREVVAQVAHQIIDELSAPYKVDHHTLYVGASVGSAIGPRDGNTVEELMRNADLALYRSKDEGGGEHFAFEPYLHASADERRQLEAALRGALGSDEMVLHFQPVVGARDENIVSFEALLRWNSKEHGFVSPGKFVPLAEETRLIVPIGKWVLRQACLEATNWPSHVKVNVNVSPEQLLEPGFADEVVAVLSESGLRPERLEIEVTESIFLRDASIARGALEQVMALGCSIALDDFGTGYSSLGYLRKLQFSTIKVDRTFVQGAAQGAAESIAIIRAVVAMAQSLELTTTAEGVETSEEADLIRSLGCDKIQGYYFGRPMTATDAKLVFKRKSDRRRA
jgi:diguanylate cyclase (GGDEF)-like protein/PAS domain S-box-containing protein